MRTTLTLPGAALAVLLIAADAAAAAERPAAARGEPGWRFSLAAAAVNVAEADLDGGGRTSSESYHFRAGAGTRINEKTMLGLYMNYDAHDRDFIGGGFAALDPWDRTHRLGFTGALNRRLGFLSLGLRPFVSWSSERGDLDSDAMTYGASLALLAGLSSDRRIGIGARLSRDLDDDTSAAPVVIVDWRINDHWAVGNPLETTFTVPAGLEVRYRTGEKWRFALAGVYQSNEFRLDGRGVAPDGIGESDGILSWLRVTRRLSPDFSVNAYFGALLDGELSVEDRDGMTLAKSGYDTSPFAAVALEGSF